MRLFCSDAGQTAGIAMTRSDTAKSGLAAAQSPGKVRQEAGLDGEKDWLDWDGLFNYHGGLYGHLLTSDTARTSLKVGMTPPA